MKKHVSLLRINLYISNVSNFNFSSKSEFTTKLLRHFNSSVRSRPTVVISRNSDSKKDDYDDSDHDCTDNTSINLFLQRGIFIL